MLTLVHDPLADRLLAWGGWPGTVGGDVWAWEPVGGWTQLAATGTGPSVAHAAAATWDPTTESLFVHGGRIDGQARPARRARSSRRSTQGSSARGSTRWPARGRISKVESGSASCMARPAGTESTMRSRSAA